MWDRIPPSPAQSTLPGSFTQGWPLSQVAAGAAPFWPAAGCLPAPAGCSPLGRCLHRGAKLPVAANSQPWLGHTAAGGGTRAVRCSQEPALRDQELRLLCQELRRRWSGAETGSSAARRRASLEVEFTCGLIRAKQARPSVAARPKPPRPGGSSAGSTLSASPAPS